MLYYFWRTTGNPLSARILLTFAATTRFRIFPGNISSRYLSMIT